MPISAPCCVLPCGLHLQYNLFYFFDSWWLMLLHHQCDVKQTWLLWLQKTELHRKEHERSENSAICLMTHSKAIIEKQCCQNKPVIAWPLRLWYDECCYIWQGFQTIIRQSYVSRCARFCKISLKLAYSLDVVPQRYTRTTKLITVTIIIWAAITAAIFLSIQFSNALSVSRP